MKRIFLLCVVGITLCLLGCRQPTESNTELVPEPIEKVKFPTITLEGNATDAGQEITLTSATEGASMYYTIDGSIPATTVSGSTKLYNELKKPVLSVTSKVHVIATKEGMDPSDVESETLAKIMPVTSVVGGSYDGETISDLYVGTYEITQGQWEAIMKAWPDTIPEESGFGASATHPAYFVNWYDAIRFCNALSIKEGFEPVYAKTTGEPIGISDTFDIADLEVNTSKNGYRLPTKNEWNYVMTDGGTKKYAGTDVDADLPNYACYKTIENPLSGVQPVGTKIANDFGLFDMNGNVWEWVFDKHIWGDTRVHLGGGWDSEQLSHFTGSSGTSSPSNNSNNRGFRVVRKK